MQDQADYTQYKGGEVYEEHINAVNEGATWSHMTYLWGLR